MEFGAPVLVSFPQEQYFEWPTYLIDFTRSIARNVQIVLQIL